MTARGLLSFKMTRFNFVVKVIGSFFDSECIYV